MHDTSLLAMKNFVAAFLKPEQEYVIGDLGAMDLNGCYRPLFNGNPKWRYYGLDVEPGHNVDFVVPKNEPWQLGIAIDVLISGQTLEHIAQPWEWINNWRKALSKGALVCIIAPHTWDYHACPIDCWRIWPDGMRGLFDWGGIEVIDIYQTQFDTVGIGRAP